MRHASARRLFRLEAASVIPGFRVVAVTPRVPSLAAGDTLTLFAETVVDRTDARTVQFQLDYVTDAGQRVLAVLTRTLKTVPSLRGLYASPPAVFLVNVLKLALTRAGPAPDDLRATFRRLLFAALLNYNVESALGNLPYNSDALCALCCAVLSTPALCPDLADDPAFARPLLVAGLLQRLEIQRHKARDLLPLFLRELYVVKLAGPAPLLVKTTLTLRHTPGQTWFVLRVKDRLTHYVVAGAPATARVLGDDAAAVPDAELRRRWEAFVAAHPALEAGVAEHRLADLPYDIRLVPDLRPLAAMCYEHLLFRFADPVVYKVELMRRIDEKKRSGSPPSPAVKMRSPFSIPDFNLYHFVSCFEKLEHFSLHLIF